MVWYVKSVEIVMFVEMVWIVEFVEIVKMVKSVWIVLIVSGFALSSYFLSPSHHPIFSTSILPALSFIGFCLQPKAKRSSNGWRPVISPSHLLNFYLASFQP
jgi:hypothetical protein